MFSDTSYLLMLRASYETREIPVKVIPAQAGNPVNRAQLLDSRLRGNDVKAPFRKFPRVRNISYLFFALAVLHLIELPKPMRGAIQRE